MSRAWTLVLLLAACGSTARPLPMPAPACGERFVGQVMSESVAVAATPTDVYWLDYNAGRLERRARGGGPAVTLARPSREQLSESLQVAGDHLVWDSKAEQAVFRRWLAAPPGTPAERIIAFDDEFPVALAVAGSVVYALTIEGRLAWWRDGLTGSRRLPSTAMSAHGDALYLGSEAALWRLTAPEGDPERLFDAGGQVAAVAVSGDTIFWITRHDHAAELHRRPLAGGDDELLLETGPYDLGELIAGPGGVYTWDSNALLFAGTAGAPRTVAHVAADIVDVAVAAPSMFVGTALGSVHEVCIDPEAAVTAAPPAAGPLACPDGLTYQQLGRREVCADDQGRWVGPSREWYASGHLKEQRSDDGSQTFYADGTVALELTDVGGLLRATYATGQLAGELRGDDWQAYELDGTPVED